MYVVIRLANTQWKVKIPWYLGADASRLCRPGRHHLHSISSLSPSSPRISIVKVSRFERSLSKWKQTQNPRDAQRKISVAVCSAKQVDPLLWNHNYFIINCAIVVVTNTQQQWSSLLPLFSSALPQPSLPLLRLATLPPFDRLLLKLTLSPRVRRSSLKLRMWVLSCLTTKQRFRLRRERMK